jgi:hypothetical protein
MASTITAAQVEAAITEILTGGQEVTVGDRTYRAPDLQDLQRLLKDVTASEQSNAGTMFTRATFGRVR